MTFSTSPDLGDARASLGKLRTKFAPLATVLLAHIVVVYLISSGLFTRMVDVALPKAVTVQFVELPHEKIPPAAPKVIPLVQLQPPALPQVPVPVVQVAPQPDSITVEQAAAPAPKPAAPPVVVAAAPAAPVSGEPKTVTSGIEYIRAPQLAYPAMSRRMGEQGRVILRVLVNEKGQPVDVKVQTSSGFARLDEASRQAGLRAQFKPFIEDGRAISAYVLLPFSYSTNS
ncbi:energy transducer TonB [Massilia sp. CF038]|uniref:energy transducer TonB n=1 Tax=Massilia sp. CF038 TaxID=1881045 RepID=UPI0009198194|nr:energy transducer TonB [Massilia sp. CF038]SHH56018.1 outer membrane transport energization protein TonB [Massilia sp. CF038]